MRKLFFTMLLTASLLSAQTALGWNGAGHMTVAGVAYNNLSDSTRQRVNSLMRQHPDFTRLRQRAGVPQSHPDFGRRLFMQFATWPDVIKSDARFFEDGATPTTLGAGFPSMERHRGWHFIDTPFSTDGTQTAPPPEPNAITELPRLISEIGNASVPRNLQAYDLAWLVHLTGDVHQPLHSATRFTSKHGPPEGDRGGNAFTIRLSQSELTNLHSFWDALLSTSINAPVVKGVATSISNEFPAESPANTTPSDWAQQSFEAAQQTAYSIGPDGTGDPTPRVTQTYRQSARRVARERGALAGYRLAAVLNERLP
jgi:hypothetical protein